jgi:hypothetical protein
MNIYLYVCVHICIYLYVYIYININININMCRALSDPLGPPSSYEYTGEYDDDEIGRRGMYV